MACMYDPRLVGVWRSDAKRTGRELAARRDIPTRSKKGLSRLFGKLEFRFTRTKCYATLNGHTERSFRRERFFERCDRQLRTVARCRGDLTPSLRRLTRLGHGRDRLVQGVLQTSPTGAVSGGATKSRFSDSQDPPPRGSP